MTVVREPSGTHAGTGAMRCRRKFERGASLVEYALLVTLIAIVCFVAVIFFASSTSETFSRVGDSVEDA